MHKILIRAGGLIELTTHCSIFIMAYPLYRHTGTAMQEYNCGEDASRIYCFNTDKIMAQEGLEPIKTPNNGIFLTEHLQQEFQALADDANGKSSLCER